jgi:hypothetical protein
MIHVRDLTTGIVHELHDNTPTWDMLPGDSSPCIEVRAASIGDEPLERRATNERCYVMSGDPSEYRHNVVLAWISEVM